LLLAVCVIPFALAQRNTTRRTWAKRSVVNTAVATPQVTWRTDGTVPAGAGISAKTSSRPQGVVCPRYTITPRSDAIVPGDTDPGLHTDDGDTFVAFPFSFQLYDQTYNGVNVNTNGRADFVCTDIHTQDWVSACLPVPTRADGCPFDYTIYPLWE